MIHWLCFHNHELIACVQTRPPVEDCRLYSVFLKGWRRPETLVQLAISQPPTDKFPRQNPSPYQQSRLLEEGVKRKCTIGCEKI